jgi:D-alanine-D-alanine ligase
MSRPLSELHVAVLLGGLSAEREVSLVSGKGCADALEGQVAKVSAASTRAAIWPPS